MSRWVRLFIAMNCGAYEFLCLFMTHEHSWFSHKLRHVFTCLVMLFVAHSALNDRSKP